MCRNIKLLYHFEPPATEEEIRASALQYVRKVGSLASVSEANRAAVERAVARISEATLELLEALPERRVPPKVDPPLRRIAARAAT